MPVGAGRGTILNERMKKPVQPVRLLLAALMLLFGYGVAAVGYDALQKWPYTSLEFAALGLLWLIVGPSMLAGGLWALGSLGRARIPFWISGGGAMLAGGSLIAGVLSYAIPCSGPD